MRKKKKQNTFGEVGEQENVSPQSQPNPGQYKLMRAARLKIQKSAQKKKERKYAQKPEMLCILAWEIWKYGCPLLPI